MAATEEAPCDGGAQRLDKWLWHARLAKSRTGATRLIEEGRLRVNRDKVAKASHNVRPGDVVTAVINGRPRVIRVLALSPRRLGPEPARALYEDLPLRRGDDGRGSGADPAR